MKTAGVHHYGIVVRNLGEAADFYLKAFNMKVIIETEWEGETLLFVGNDEQKIELIQQKKNQDDGAHTAFQIDCIEDMIHRLQNEGFLPLEGPFLLNNGWKTVFYELPEGGWVEFIEE
ncbi:lactoylglutathione lyase [Fictibacillus solisalsi]|uniref:Lactoylglutathione lyase n=1 Tax=Fictibacillus solisalsi TaxID=459525 RepID=A0A1H0CAS6_9BACL|nr:VOC family protein [Fictibacillus solisalsi]SDN54891.1 lactoylglutathione lyase [Fictibacillus solisalsi]